ncbi:HAD-IA family hydrolase [Umezawaea endophytica]|uniref:HAD-IA family hydrolase n=1 Tax=Umezawaea endophytica TaxID=1654476 RepID=A0A9X2VPW4_9PSEU|nr:HAD-IA family hydrolase [Umezawaea endophytica]MCS7480282.1 HAD-IA family hydrolase [Umezawaea endophytica]
MLVVECDAVLFDNDGVLVDSDAGVYAAWSRWARSFGLPVDEVTEAVHGRRAVDTVALLVPEGGRAGALADITRWEVEEAAGTTAVPGAVALVRSLPRGVWAVVTSGVTALARARLEAAGFPEPSVMVAADDVVHGKPAPDGYLAAAKALGVRPDRAVVVEDSAAGIAAGRAAGVAKVVGVGERAVRAGADLVVRDLTGLRWAAGELHVDRATLLG